MTSDWRFLTKLLDRGKEEGMEMRQSCSETKDLVPKVEGDAVGGTCRAWSAYTEFEVP